MFGLVLQDLLVIIVILAIVAVPVWLGWLWGRNADNVATIEKVATGQKLVIYAILANFLAVGLQAGFGNIWGLVGGIVALVLSLIGVSLLGSAMGHSLGINLLSCVLMLVPMINIVTLLVLSFRATKALRAAGYKVGLLGASRQ